MHLDTSRKNVSLVNHLIFDNPQEIISLSHKERTSLISKCSGSRPAVPDFKWFRSQRSIATTTTTTTTGRWKRPQNLSFEWLHNVIISVILWVFLSDLTTINSHSEINPLPNNPVKACQWSFPYSSLKILCYGFVYTAPWKYRIPRSWDQPCLRSIHMPIAASHFVSFASCGNQFLAPVAGPVLRGNLFWVEKPWLKNRPFEIYLKVSAQINSWHVEANY